MAAGDEQQPTSGRWHTPAAIALAFIHILTFCGMAYQNHIHKVEWSSDYSFFANWGVWLSPALLPLISRKHWPLLLLCAIPILGIFGARMYHVFQLYSLDVNSMAVQKGDGLWFLTSLFGMLATVIIAFWLLFCAMIFLPGWVDNLSRRQDG